MVCGCDVGVTTPPARFRAIPEVVYSDPPPLKSGKGIY